MTFLASIPIWVYFIILAITFMVVHVMALRANQPQNRARNILGRVGSSLILLIALFFLNPADPGSLLISLVVAGIAGFISGRTATPPPLPPRGGAAAAQRAETEEDDSTKPG